METWKTTRPVAVTINGLTLRLAPGTRNLLALGTAQAVWLAGPKGGRPLWSLLAVDAAGRRVTLTGANGAAAATRTAGTLALRWNALTDPATGAGPFDVTVTVRAAGTTKRATAWRIRVDNRTTKWTLWHVEFPRLEGLRASAKPGTDRLCWSDCWGIEYAGAAGLPKLRRWYPFGWETTMQFFGYSRGAQTLYLGTHDPRLTTKEYIFTPPPDGTLAVVNYPAGMTRPGNSFRQDYDTVVAVLDGDWFDASRLYAGWARPQPWATASPPAASAAPRAAREVDAWLVMQVPDKPLARWAEQTEQLAARLEGRLGVHCYNWHEVPFDTSYPDYFPARAGFKELVARLRQARVVMMPYINARLWDINARSWTARGAVDFAAKTAAQRVRPRTLFPYLEEYGSGQKLAPMCPTTAFWRQTVVELCRRITGELACDGVYLDQIAAAHGLLCFDPTHGHPLGGGGFWLEGYRQLAREIRETIGAQPLLTTECNWEGCIADYDALLSWHRFADNQVPMFPVVYAGQARMFGCQFAAADLTEQQGDSFARRMAMLLVWGGQLGWGDLTLLLEPRHRRLAEYFARLCRLRAAHRELFATGQMLRPPSLPAPPVGRPRALYTSLWRSADGRRTFLFTVNPTRHPVRAKLRLTALAGSAHRAALVTVKLDGLGAEVRELA